MPMIHYSCPTCGQKHQATDEARGVRHACTGCGQKLLIPDATTTLHRPTPASATAVHPSVTQTRLGQTPGGRIPGETQGVSLMPVQTRCRAWLWTVLTFALGVLFGYLAGHTAQAPESPASAMGDKLVPLPELTPQQAEAWEKIRRRRYREHPCIIVAWSIRPGSGPLMHRHVYGFTTRYLGTGWDREEAKDTAYFHAEHDRFRATAVVDAGSKDRPFPVIWYGRDGKSIKETATAPDEELARQMSDFLAWLVREAPRLDATRQGGG